MPSQDGDDAPTRRWASSTAWSRCSPAWGDASAARCEHGTTIATTALEAVPARLITQGFEFILEIARQPADGYGNSYFWSSRRMCRPTWSRPSGPARSHRPSCAFDEEGAVAVARWFLTTDWNARRLFLHSYANPDTSGGWRPLLAERSAASSRFLDVLREYASTSVGDHAARRGRQTAVATYLMRSRRLDRWPAAASAARHQSTRGAQAREVTRLPITTVLSGPAAAPSAPPDREQQHHRVLTCDGAEHHRLAVVRRSPH